MLGKTNLEVSMKEARSYGDKGIKPRIIIKGEKFYLQSLHHRKPGKSSMDFYRKPYNVYFPYVRLKKFKGGMWGIYARTETKMPIKKGDCFNRKGRRYQMVFTRGLSRSLAKEKLAARRLDPRFMWAMKKVSDGTYAIGRTARKGKNNG